MSEIFADQMPEYTKAVSNQFLVGSFADVLIECNPIITQSIRDNFTSSATPDNVSWPPRKIEGDGHPLLMDTGKLIQAATLGGEGGYFAVEDRELNRGIDADIVPYATTHQFGWAKKNIPQRAYYGAKPEHLDQCAELIAEFALSFFVGAA